MKCPKCNGSGEIKHDWLPHETCHNCGGSGYVEMTNEEYLRSLNTEQLAEFLLKTLERTNDVTIIVMDALADGIDEEKSIVEWLKQPHTKGVKSEI